MTSDKNIKIEKKHIPIRLLKWAMLTILSISVILIVLFVVLVKYNLNKTCAYIINKETHGTYNLTIGDNSIDLFKHAVVLNDVHILSSDSQSALQDINVKSLNIELESISRLLTEKKLIVKNITIGQTELVIKLKKRKKPLDVKLLLSNIEQSLNKVLKNIELTHLELNNFNITLLSDNEPIKVGQIDLRISNLSSKNDTSFTNLNYSLNIGKQNVVLPKQKFVSFSKISISRNTGLFVDSLSFVKYLDLNGVHGPVFLWLCHFQIPTLLQQSVYQLRHAEIHPKFFSQ